jgi:hypothetical protein
MAVVKRICICVGLLMGLALYSYLAIEVQAADEMRAVETADGRY